MKLFILACIVTAASASPFLLGSKKCTQGPAYWCQGYKQAAECGAIEHCKQKVWSLKNQDECSTCVMVMTEVQALLSSNDTVKEVIAELENFCSILGQKSQCKALVDLYAPQIIAYLQQILKDPKQVCKELSLCGAQKKSTILASLLKNSLPRDNLVNEILEPGPVLVMEKQNPVKKVDASAKCVLCEFVMRELDNEIGKKSTQDEIKLALEKVCKLMPESISAECTSFVDEYAPAVLAILANELDPAMVCSSLSLCSSKNSIPVVLEKVKSTEKCVICEFAMRELDSILEENSTTEKIEEALDKVCGILPETVSQNCADFVKQYTPVLVQVLTSMGPDEVCKAIHLCAESAKPVAEKKPKVGESTQCILCEFVMDKLENILKQNATEQEIQEALDKVCSLLPSTVSEECETFVNKYTPEIVQFLVNELSPKELCTALKMCTQSKISKQVKTIQSGLECEACQYIMGYLDSILTKNATEQEIKKDLDKVCSLLPSSVSSECKEIVDQYAAAIVQLLVDGLSPDKVCTEIGLCSGSKISKPAKKLTIPSDTTCSLCQTAFALLKNFIDTNRTEEALVQDLEKLCSALPEQISSECNDLVKEYGKELLDIPFNMTPEQICTDLTLCPSAKNMLQLSGKGKAPCFLGVQYWCSNMAAAVECDAVHHCKNHVW